MNVDKMWELTLYQVLRVNGNVYYLIDEKHSYTNVLLYISTLRKHGMVNKIDDSFQLTRDGHRYYHQLSRTLGKRGLYKYFMESIENKTESINNDDIYIPRKRFKL